MVETILKIRRDMLEFLGRKAEDHLRKNTREVRTKDELRDAVKKGGFIKLNFCGRRECSDEMKSQTGGFEVKGTLYGKEELPKGRCAWCNQTATQVVYAAKTY